MLADKINHHIYLAPRSEEDFFALETRSNIVKPNICEPSCNLLTVYHTQLARCGKPLAIKDLQPSRAFFDKVQAIL